MPMRGCSRLRSSRSRANARARWSRRLRLGRGWTLRRAAAAGALRGARQAAAPAVLRQGCASRSPLAASLGSWFMARQSTDAGDGQAPGAQQADQADSPTASVVSLGPRRSQLIRGALGLRWPIVAGGQMTEDEGGAGRSPAVSSPLSQVALVASGAGVRVRGNSRVATVFPSPPGSLARRQRGRLAGLVACWLGARPRPAATSTFAAPPASHRSGSRRRLAGRCRSHCRWHRGTPAGGLAQVG